MRKLLFLLAPDPVDGNPAPGENPENLPAETPENPEGAPPAARIVVTGAETEETAKLREKLAEKEKRERELETRLAEKEDECHRLKSAGLATTEKAKTQKRAFLDGWEPI